MAVNELNGKPVAFLRAEAAQMSAKTTGFARGEKLDEPGAGPPVRVMAR